MTNEHSNYEQNVFGGNVELRAAGDDPDAPPVIVGYAAVFNALSEDLHGFREKIDPGAFAKTMGADVRALFNHNADIVLGRTRSKTLLLEQDNKGLRVSITPPQTEQATHIVELIKRGDVSQMSFGFRTLADKWEINADTGKQVRTLLEVELFDVSPVTYAAYKQTQVAIRSLEKWQADIAPAPVFDFAAERLQLLELEI